MKLLTAVLLTTATIFAQQPPTRFVFGAPNTFTTPGDHVWSNSLPCPKDATFYTVTFPSGGKFGDFQQYNTLCYSIKPMQVDVITNPGLYIVRFYFIEQNPAVKVGGRTFNISINGDIVARDYDIYKHCGLYAGCNQSFVVADQMGKISVVLNVTKYNAVLSAIEVIRLREYGDVIGEAEPLQ